MLRELIAWLENMGSRPHSVLLCDRHMEEAEQDPRSCQPRALVRCGRKSRLLVGGRDEAVLGENAAYM